MFWTCFEVTFFQKGNRQCTLEGRGLEKTLEKEKRRNFQKCPKTIPKNIVWECFDWFFRRKKLCPVHPGDSKKFHRNRKEFKFSKTRKTFPKVSKLTLGNFFEFFLPTAPWRVETWKRKDRKKWKISIFRGCPKLSLILSEHVLSPFWGNFFSKKNRHCTL